MNVEELLKLIPEEKLEFLAAETKVDHQVKKLSGSVIFKLVLFSMLGSDKVSLRVMETLLQSAKFKQFAGQEMDAKYNSIRDRICTMNVEFFKRLFENIFELYNKELKEETSISKADSTYVSIAASLVGWSMQTGTSNESKRRQIKYSVALKGSLPCSVRIFNEKKFISENLALGELIENSIPLKESIVVFDRGLTARKAFDKFTGEGIGFIGRCNPGNYCKKTASNAVPIKPKNSTVTITQDITGFLRADKNILTNREYRLVSGIIDETNEAIHFVTNLAEEDAYTIASLYRQRWEIEVFFKFIKQHLNVSHLVSRQKNGIEIMLYMTMIAAILIIAFKKLNKMQGYKIPKLKFEIQLDNLLIKEIVVLCGGNPNKASHLWNTS